jgi:hypothetical protein
MITSSSLSTALLFIKLSSLPLELQAKIFSYLPLSFFEQLKLDHPDQVKKIKEIWSRVFSNMGSLEQALIFKKDVSSYHFSRLNLYLKKEVREIVDDAGDSADSRSIQTLAFSCLHIDSFIHTRLHELPNQKLLALILFTLLHHDLTALECSIKQNMIFSPFDLKEILEQAVRLKDQKAVEMIAKWDQINQVNVINFFEIFKLCFEDGNLTLAEILINTPSFEQLNQEQISYLFLEGCKERKKGFISLFKTSCRAMDLTAETLGQGIRFGSLIKDPSILREILTYPTSDLIQNIDLSKGLSNAVTHENIENIEIILSSTHARGISPINFGTIFAHSFAKKDLSITSMLMMAPNYKEIQKRELMKALYFCCEKNAFFYVGEILSHPNFGQFDQSIAYDLYNQACVNNFDQLKTLLFRYIPHTFQICERIKELNCTVS